MKSLASKLILLLFLIAAFRLSAQQDLRLKSVEQQAENEKLAYNSLMQPHEQLIVNNYDLKYHRFFLFADPAKASISGSITSYFVSTQAGMSSIQFELYKALFADSAVYNGGKKNISRNGNVITIPFGVGIPEGKLDSVTVYYHGDPTASGFGSFGNGVHAGIPAMWTLSEPYGASDWWPSKNDLTDKIDSIDVFVVTPRANHVASNGLLISETAYDAKSVLAHWKHRYPIASYLIAIASTNYARFSNYYVTATDSLEVLNYVYPEDSLLLSFNARDALPAFEVFERLFTPYPFRNEKYGQAQFGWGGGMEHQTMTFLGKSAFSPETISHELAHQWFGDMITCGSWHDIWLNEGFATYCAALRFETTDPAYWVMWKNFNIASICSLPYGSVYCDDTTNVNRIFDSRLSYRKGAGLLHMLRWMLGDDIFFQGIRNYLEDPKIKHGFARNADFITHMELASNKDLSGFFADWLYGQGYPTYTINVNQADNFSTTITLYQQQSHSSVSFFELPVPVHLIGDTRDTIMRLNNSFSGQMFEVNPGFAVRSIKFDPDYWLISANNTVSLGTSDLPAGKLLALMPNPVNDFLIVQHSLGEIKSLEIMNMEGKPMKVGIKNENSSQINVDTKTLDSGMYLLRIMYKEGIVSRKFVVKR